MRWWILNVGWGVVIIALALLVANDLAELKEETRSALIGVLGVVVALIVGSAAAFVAYLQRSTAEKQVYLTGKQLSLLKDQAQREITAQDALADLERQKLALAERNFSLAQLEFETAKENHKTELEKIRLNLFDRRSQVFDALFEFSAEFYHHDTVTDRMLREFSPSLNRSMMLFDATTRAAFDDLWSDASLVCESNKIIAEPPSEEAADEAEHALEGALNRIDKVHIGKCMELVLAKVRFE